MHIFQEKVLPLHRTKALFEKARLGNAMKSASFQIVTHLNGNLL